MKQVWYSNGCSLNLNSLSFLTGRATTENWACSLQQHKISGPLSLLYLCLALVLSPEETEFGYKVKESTRSTLPRFCPTDTSVSAWRVRASCLHSSLGSGPSSCLLSPEARPIVLSGTQPMSMGGEAGGVRRAGDCYIYLWRRCCEGCVQIWLRGNLCPPHLYPDPDSDPSLSSPFYHENAWRPHSTCV